MADEKQINAAYRWLVGIQAWAAETFSWSAAAILAVGAVTIGLSEIWFLPEFVKIVLREFGRATFIAWLVYMGYEFFARRAHHESLDEKFDEQMGKIGDLHQKSTQAIESFHAAQDERIRDALNKQIADLERKIAELSGSVFRGVFGRDLPKEFIQEAERLLFNSAAFVREKMSADYELQDDQYDAGGGLQQPYVRLTSRATFTLRNISGEQEVAPIQVAVPNPIALGLIDKVQIGFARATLRAPGRPDAMNVINFDVDQASHDLREAMRNAVPSGNAAEMQLARVGQCELLPGHELDIIIEYTMAKETEDTEVLTMAGPTAGLRVNIVDRSPGKRVLNMRAIHRKQLVNTTASVDGGRHSYHLDGYLLPKQGVILWWKESQPRPRLRDSTGERLSLTRS